MSIRTERLQALAEAYVEPMTSIRGRRVRRLILREFSRFDVVAVATCDDGAPGLFGVSEDGAAALCRTDGRGPAAEIIAWAGVQAPGATSAYDLKKDSLPLLSRIASRQLLKAVAAALVFQAEPGGEEDRETLEALLRPLADQAHQDREA